ncbi:MAG: hypothetical protein ACM3H8_15945, partial [Sphingobacteriales bacterium]
MRTIQKIFLVTIFLLGLLVLKNAEAQSLDVVKDTSKLTKDLKDLYKAHNINHIIADQNEMINLYLSEDGPDELNKLLSEYIKKCEALKPPNISNNTLKSLLENYITGTIKNYQVMKLKGFKSSDFKKDYSNYKKVKEKYMDYLMNIYTTNYFVNLTEDKYWKVLDKKNYVKDNRYASLQTTKENNLRTAMQILDTLSDSTLNFQEKTIYKIALADMYVREKSLGTYAWDTAISIYKFILEKKEYSLYLFESWIKWRTVSQQSNGLSKSSEIPNDEYDKVREQVAQT